MTGTSKEKRHFSRVPFDCDNITITVGDSTWQTELVDICLNGALLVRPAEWTPTVGSECRVDIRLNDDAVITMMQAFVAHSDDDRVGVRSATIDVDSISHLRRLVDWSIENWPNWASHATRWPTVRFPPADMSQSDHLEASCVNKNENFLPACCCYASGYRPVAISTWTCSGIWSGPSPIRMPALPGQRHRNPVPPVNRGRRLRMAST